MTKRFLGIVALLSSVAVVTGCVNEDPAEMESEDEDIATVDEGMDGGDVDPELDTAWFGGCGLGGIGGFGYGGYGGWGLGYGGYGYGYGGLGSLAGLGLRVPGYAVFGGFGYPGFGFGGCGCGGAVIQQTTVVAGGGCGGCGGCLF